MSNTNKKVVKSVIIRNNHAEAVNMVVAAEKLGFDYEFKKEVFNIQDSVEVRYTVTIYGESDA